MQLEVRTVPNAKRFSVSLKDGLCKVHVAAKAEDNRANEELVGMLSRALGMRVSIVRGSKSRHKVLEIEGNEAEVGGRLRKIASEMQTKSR
ncbi:putative ACR, YggU family [uncultured archaeon]|nr:putative ACR, YggU family [uncultured archaeon]